jgi:site-specific DNA recombinase
MESKKRVGIWIRVSTEEQAESESPEHHEQRARWYCDAREWTVATVYHLEAVSGKSVMEHPEAKRMLKDIKEGFITGLVFSKLARLARSTKDLLAFSDYFQEHGADLISVQETIDTSTPAGRLFYTIISAMAQWEREEIASRVAASVPVRAKLGKPLGGAAPYGYRWEGGEKEKRLVIDEEEAPVRKLMYEIFDQCKRKKTTAQELNRRGYHTRSGEKFTDTTVDRLLRDPMAKGLRRANYTKSLGAGKQWALKPSEEWVLVECPAIVSEDLWNSCNAFLDEQRKKLKRMGRRSAFLLAGYVACTCGQKMYVFHNHPVYSCRKCKNRIAAETIDAIYYETLESFLLADGDVTKYIEQSDATLQEKEALLNISKAQSLKLKSQMEELEDMRIKREITSERFVARYKPLEEQQAGLQEQIAELEGTIGMLQVQRLSSDTVLHEAKKLYRQWPQLPFEDRRTLVETITEHIGIDNDTDEVTIRFSYLPAPHLPQNTGTKQHNYRGS